MTIGPDHDGALALAAGAAQVLPQGGLEAALGRSQRDARPLRVKFGIDPSGTELTLGHAVVLRKLRQFQDAGHSAVLVIGDFTATIGDPTGRSTGRNTMTLEQTTANARTYLEQAALVLRRDRMEVRRNTEWLADMTLKEILGHARTVTVAQLLERDDFAARYRQHRPLALSEFFYPLLQAIDSVAVGADVELGGADQLFNLALGRDVQRVVGQEPQVVLTMPLLVGLDGTEKMSKSLGNYVALIEPAPEQFGKLMSIPDRLVGRYAQACTSLSETDISALIADVDEGGPAAGRAKRALARAVVAIYHGEQQARRAEAGFDVRFRDRTVPQDVPTVALPDDAEVHLPALLTAAGLCSSRTEARRLIDAGAVRLDGHTLPSGAYTRFREELAGRVIQIGRRRAARLER